MTSLRARLMGILALIIVATQGTSIFWVWHESREQVTELVQLAQDPRHSRAVLEEEERETLEALLIPSFIQCLMTLLVAYVGISWVIQPLQRLTRLLQARSSSNLEPISLERSPLEVQAFTGALNELMGRLALALNRERQFSADVAHELRTPLAGIRLNLELLEHSGVAGVAPLIARLDGLHRTVEQLLAMSRLERSFIAGLGSRVELAGQVIRPLQPDIGEMLRRSGQQARFELEPGWVQGEPELLRMLLRNLIENAGRYGKPGGEVLVRLQTSGAWVELTVLDEGPGVAPEKLAGLTRAYTRLDSRGAGIGLGLNIVSRVCELHGARLEIANRSPQGGLCVRIGLPRRVE